MNQLVPLEQILIEYAKNQNLSPEEILSELYAMKSKAAAWDRLSTLIQRQDALTLGLVKPQYEIL